ncbi:MAG TPA: two-component system activity regulator YycH [Clostridia bacterium]|nr:two-component system activity regulator YycH [Clostridia bacterium]
MGKEKMKTVFLAMLFVLSVLLTHKLWIIIPSGELFPSEVDEAVEEELNIYDEILSPQSYIYNFGGGYHTIFFTDPNGTWTEVADMVDAFIEEDFAYETLSEEQWQEANEYKSVKLQFSFPVPLELFYSDYKEWNLGEGMDAIDSLLIPATERNVLYIADKSKGIHLKLKGENTGGEIASKIDGVKSIDHTDYFKTEDILGIDSDILLPINFDEEIPSVDMTAEIEVSDKTQITAMAGRIFGENFDFIKKIEENDGSVLYISSYGEKVLRIQADGLLEYTEKLEKQIQSPSPDRLESLKRAVYFVRNNGGWPSGAYISDSLSIEKSGMKGYRFLFNYKINGYPVLEAAGEGNGAISVDVYGNSVTYYKRRVLREKMDVGEGASASSRMVIVPQKVIDRNFREIAAAYIVDNGLDISEISMDQLLFDILSSIDNIQMAYYLDDKDGKEVLMPVWRIAAESRIYYFNVRNGEIMYRGRIE